jgi:hypothetical protein
LNPNAPANWLADVEKWRQTFGVTITINGQSVVRMGTLAYTFENRDDAWKIEAQAWGRTS